MVELSEFRSSASGVAAVNEQLRSKVSVDQTDRADEDRMTGGIYSTQAGDDVERVSGEYVFQTVSWEGIQYP